MLNKYLIAGFIFTFSASIYAQSLILTLTSPASLSGTLPLSASANQIGLTSLQFKLNGLNIGPNITSGNCVYNFDSTFHPNGNYTLTAEGRDTNNNLISSAAVPVIINNLSPTPVPGPTPAPVPPQGLPSDAVKLVDEGGPFTLTENKVVYYGANGVYINKSFVPGTHWCRNDTYESDPVPNVFKACYAVQSSIPIPQPTPTTNLTLSVRTTKCRFTLTDNLLVPGYGVQFQYKPLNSNNWQNVSSRSTTVFTRQTSELSPGTYQFRSVWSKSGADNIVSNIKSDTCE